MRRSHAGDVALRAQNQPAASSARRPSAIRFLALANGKTQQEIAAACKGARPNHVGVVIARHKRAGRIGESNMSRRKAVAAALPEGPLKGVPYLYQGPRLLRAR